MCEFSELNSAIEQAFGAAFQKVAVCKYMDDGSGPEYELLNKELISRRRGVYVVVTDGGEAVYVGKFLHGLHKRWFYTKLGKLYHHTAPKIRVETKDGRDISLWLIEEDAFRAAVPTDLRSFITVEGIEAALLRQFCFRWNKLGNKTEAA